MKDWSAVECEGRWIKMQIARNYNPQKLQDALGSIESRGGPPERAGAPGPAQWTHTDVALRMLDFKCSFCRVTARPMSMLKIRCQEHTRVKLFSHLSNTLATDQYYRFKQERTYPV